VDLSGFFVFMNPESVFKLTPLKWKRTMSDYWQSYTATTPFGNFTVERYRGEQDCSGPWQAWTWGYCFSEYYDESYTEIVSK
jgi:hypothetical protein